MGLREKLAKYILGSNLFTKDDRLLVAISGGVDSVVLAHLLIEMGYEIGLAHVNFQLRAQASEEDAQFVEQLAQQWQVPLWSKAINCSQYAEEHHLSIQEAARVIRYDFFNQVAAEENFGYILTAHHALDNVESIIYNLAKGTTLPTGIPLVRKNIIRPLLHCLKADILDYASTHNLSYREDASNMDDKYARNRIRHHIVDPLKKINPSLEKTLAGISQKATQYKAWIADIVQKDQQDLLTNGFLDLTSHQSRPYRSIWLFEVLAPSELSWSTIEDIWVAYDQGQSNGQQFEGKSETFLLDRARLLLIDHAVNQHHRTEYVINSIESCAADTNGLIHMGIEEEVSTYTPDQAVVDPSLITFPLTLRTWTDGDRIDPLGMEGKSKKVKKYLTDKKVPHLDKKKVQVLLQEDKIIWVVNHVVSHRFAANSALSPVLVISSK